MLLHVGAQDTVATCAEAVCAPAGASSQQKLPIGIAKLQSAPQQDQADKQAADLMQQLQQTGVNQHLRCWLRR